MNILLTGASGFVGDTLLRRLHGHDVSLLVRHGRVPGYQCFYGDLSRNSNYGEAVRSMDLVIHAAARAHIMNEEADDPLLEYRKVNVEGTLNLARQAASAGVKRFLFISSIKVNGEETSPGRPFLSDDTPDPQDAYSVSKLEAEIGLQKLADETGMEVVIIRPPLVYGQGVKGNFASLVKLVSKGVPLPLGAIKNQRSLVSVDNLVDLIFTCIDHPAAANQIFLASDGDDLSTTQLLRSVATARSVPARLISVPSSLLMFAATILGKKTIAQRLVGSLQVDISKARELLDWTPPLSVEEGLRRCFQSEIK